MHHKSGFETELPFGSETLLENSPIEFDELPRTTPQLINSWVPIHIRIHPKRYRTWSTCQI